MKRIGRFFLVVAPFLASCYSIEVDGASILGRSGAMVIGDTMRLSLVTMYGATPERVAWKSSDQTIATVSEDGVVTATGPGRVHIDARAGDHQLFAVLQVWAPAPPFAVIGSGADHNCGLDDDGRAWCWGSNQFGQLGAASPDVCVMPGAAVLCAVGAIPIESKLRFVALAVGHYHGCGLTAEGAAYCWGLNDRGQLGDGSTLLRTGIVRVAGDVVFESLAAGGRSTCGVSVDDTLFCWGQGVFLRDGTLAEATTTPTEVASEHDFEQVATSGFHTCGRTVIGSTYCWGLNRSGELGVQTVDETCGTAPCAAEPQEVVSAQRFVDLAVAQTFSCGLAAEGVAYCWGKNDRGQLGDGTNADRFEPAPVSGGRTFSKLATGSDRACGVDAESGLLCWGRDGSSFGTGRGADVETSEPLAAAPGIRFRGISVGLDVTCGLAESGLTWCWGWNRDGAVGSGGIHTNPVTIPLRVVRRTP